MDLLGDTLVVRLIPISFAIKVTAQTDVLFYIHFILVPQVEEAVPRIEAPVDSPIKNIIVHAGRPDPIALPDDQYPDWMWQLVRETDNQCEELDSESGPNDRKSLRKANKERIKANNALGS